MTTRQSSSMAGVFATAINFPVVFAGLIVIATQANGDSEIALLNLWAAWGIALGLLGQLGLVSGYLDRESWTSVGSLKIAAAAGIIGGALVFALRSSLFPSHEWWWILVGIVAATVFLVGRQRAQRTLAGDGVYALVVTAIENVVRAFLVVIAVAFTDVDSNPIWVAIAIVAPFAASIVLLEMRERAGVPMTSLDDVKSPTLASGSLVTGLLAGVPAVAAYALVPALSVIDATADLDAFAVASSLLRGPLLVASFAAPWLLETIGTMFGSAARLDLVAPAGLLAVQMIVGVVVQPALVPGLVIHGVFSGTIAALVYLSILRTTADRSTSTPVSAAALGHAVLLFVIYMALAASTDRIHPFLALSAACVAIPFVRVTATRFAEVRS
ncbi:MAG: hypothetical protein ACR2P0_17440 [Acidimicrobiales bacterium]